MAALGLKQTENFATPSPASLIGPLVWKAELNAARQASGVALGLGGGAGGATCTDEGVVGAVAAAAAGELVCCWPQPDRARVMASTGIHFM